MFQSLAFSSRMMGSIAPTTASVAPASSSQAARATHTHRPRRVVSAGLDVTTAGNCACTGNGLLSRGEGASGLGDLPPQLASIVLAFAIQPALLQGLPFPACGPAPRFSAGEGGGFGVCPATLTA